MMSAKSCTGMSRRLIIRISAACLALTWAGPAPASGEGGERAIDNIQVTAPPRAARPAQGAGAPVTIITPRRFGNLGQRELSRLRGEMIVEGKKYQVDGFSETFSLRLVTSAMADPRRTRALMEAMQNRKSPEERAALLRQEERRAEEEVKALRQSVKRLDREAGVARQTAAVSADANRNLQATLKLQAEEERRLGLAESYQRLVNDWKKNPDEGMKAP